GDDAAMKLLYLVINQAEANGKDHRANGQKQKLSSP
ncbi:MAG: hypothetical protein ACI9TB_002163, partial [Parasphingorhabdus sp.]